MADVVTTPDRPIDSRVALYCDGCKGVDSEPRHHHYDPVAGVATSFHFTCCASATGCESCTGQLAAAPAQSGEQLVEYLLETHFAAEVTAPTSTTTEE